MHQFVLYSEVPLYMFPNEPGTAELRYLAIASHQLLMTLPTWAVGQKFFMVVKCVLARHNAGLRLPWWALLQMVRSRLRIWSSCGKVSLWSETLADGHSLSGRGK